MINTPPMLITHPPHTLYEVKVIENWPNPTSIIEVIICLGIVQYWRIFNANFLFVASPLHALTSAKQVFQWEDKYKKAFDTLKEKMSTTLVLTFPYLEKEFKKETDAC